MKADLPGEWSIEIPDDFCTDFNDDTWEAHDDGESRNVYVTVYRVSSPTSPEELLELLDSPPEPIVHQEGMLIGYASITHGDDDLVTLQGVSYVLGTAAICTIALAGDHDLPWALDTWKTLSCVPPHTAWLAHS